MYVCGFISLFLDKWLKIAQYTVLFRLNMCHSYYWQYLFVNDPAENLGFVSSPIPLTKICGVVFFATCLNQLGLKFLPTRKKSISLISGAEIQSIYSYKVWELERDKALALKINFWSKLIWRKICSQLLKQEKPIVISKTSCKNIDIMAEQPCWQHCSLGAAQHCSLGVAQHCSLGATQHCSQISTTLFTGCSKTLLQHNIVHWVQHSIVHAFWQLATGSAFLRV